VSALNIRAVNEALRTAMTGGLVFMTAGVDALSSDAKATVIRATFTEFTRDNDPHGEHYFGNFGRVRLGCTPRRYPDAACLGSPGMPRISARLRKPGS
jgi:hypothetical protein